MIALSSRGSFLHINRIVSPCSDATPQWRFKEIDRDGEILE